MKTLFNILLLEDSDNFAETVEIELKSRVHGRGKVHVHRVANELDFRRQVDGLTTQNFDIGIFDVMVNWCGIRDLNSPEGENPPAEVQDELDGKAPYRGGFRCRNLFRERLAALGKPDVPCVYYSILNEKELRAELGSESTPALTKSGEFSPLVDMILEIDSQKHHAASE